MATKKIEDEQIYLKVKEENDQSPINEETTKPVQRTGRFVNSKFVRIRQVPSTAVESEVVAFMSKGDTADIMEELENFYKVRTHKGDKVGYVNKKYFREV